MMQLNFTGHGKYNLTNNKIIAPTGLKVKQVSETELEISDGAGGGGSGASTVTCNGMTITSNGSVSMSGGSFFFGGSRGSSGSVATDGTTVNINGISYVACTINGQKVFVPAIPEMSQWTGAVKQEPLVKEYTLTKPVETIKTSGSANVQITDPEMITDQCSFYIVGSGVIVANGAKKSNVNANVCGSGEIHLPWTIGTLMAQISGSGDIAGFVITNTGMLNVSGSGCIAGKKMPGASVSQSRAGSGSIRCIPM